MYEIASKNNNYKALKVLFENEIDTKNVLTNDKIALRRILQHNLIENSIESKDIEFMKKVFVFKKFDFKYLKCEKILFNAFKNYKSSNSTQKDDEIAQFLIKSVVSSPNYTPSYKTIILNIAIRAENFEMVRFLIESKDLKYTTKDINSKDSRGDYPIIKALSVKNIEIFDYLLDHGADYNTKNEENESLLFLAIEQNDIDYVISLINSNSRNKINVNLLNKDGFTPLKISFDNDNMDIFNYLIYYCDINKTDKYGHRILYYTKHHESIVNKLTDIGAKNDNAFYNWLLKQLKNSKEFIRRSFSFCKDSCKHLFIKILLFTILVIFIIYRPIETTVILLVILSFVLLYYYVKI